MCPRHHPSFCACNTAWIVPELLDSKGPSHYVWFLHAKQRLLGQNYKYLICPRPHLSFCANREISITITSLYGSQPSSVNSGHAKQRLIGPEKQVSMGPQTSQVVMCLQNSVISTRITCLYGSQPLSVIFACKTAWFALELLGLYVGPNLHLLFSACKTACLASELLVWMGSNPHLSFLNEKQRLLDQNN